MRDTLPNGREIPVGMDFLRLVWQQEDDCEAQTDAALPKIGKKAPECIHELGTVLSLLDRLASCFWGCAKGDHVIEYLAGRTAGFARAALRLTRFGFYDEALVLVRGVGEIGNLLTLFARDDSVMRRWTQSSTQERIREFGPAKVRKALDQRGVHPPMSEAKYSRLCEIAAHVTPETRPQNYNVHGHPAAGAFFQEAGVLVTLNELSASVAVVAMCAAKLVLQDTEKRKEIRAAVFRLLDSVGGASLLSIDDYFDQLRKSS